MTTYKIQSGDTLTSIAKKYNTTVDAIAGANGIKNKNLIYAGSTLTIPSAQYGGGSVDVSGSKDTKITSEKIAGDIDKWKEKRPAENKNTYSDEIKGLVSKITGMDFSYDPEKDIAYRLMRDANRKNARLAMEDTLGKALSLTGGYANSFAEGAAQQAYGGELSKTQDIIPELYKAAYDRFDSERDALSDAVELLSGLDNKEFDKYNTLMKQYLSEGEFLYDNFKDISKEEFDRFYDYTALMNKLAK